MPAIVAAHRDVFRAFQAMPKLTLAVALIIIGQAVFDVVVFDRMIPAESLFGRDILVIVQEFLIAPFLIAVHRFIILDEVTPTYVLEPRSARFQMFFGWQVVVLVLSRIVEPIILLLGKNNPVGYAIVGALFIAGAVVITRMTILFPAIAVDAPGATLRNAFHDTKGHGWYIFFLFLFACLPTLLAAIIASLLGVAVLGLVAGRVVILIVVSGAVVVLMALAVAIASRLYMALGDRVNGPLVVPPA